jgi:hypothetical protein
MLSVLNMLHSLRAAETADAVIETAVNEGI